MINEVFIIGKVKSATEKNDGKVLDLLVEYKRYYGFGDNAGFSVNDHNVYLVSNTETTKQFLDNSNKAKKPTYIGIRGMLAERNMDPPEGSDNKYGPSQVYILGLKVLQLSNEIETSECRAYFQGDVVWKDSKYTKNDKPMTKFIVKNQRESKNREGEVYTKYTAIPVTVFREGIDVPYDKGDNALFAGNLDSYELREYPGVFTSTLTSFDYVSGEVSHTSEEAGFSNAEENTDEIVGAATDTDDEGEEIDLPF